MRGEKPYILFIAPRISGSSPHARGKVLHLKSSNGTVRIIPACAGKSSLLPGRFLCTQDHPRMRGEKVDDEISENFDLGSSPHARGKELQDGASYDPNRIIPACAGKSKICCKLFAKE